jgi:predicted phage tail protein
MSTAELTAVHLHGSLGERFGKLHRFAVTSPAEAFRAMIVQFEGFRAAIAEASWEVIRGEPETGMYLNEHTLTLGVGHKPLHVIPSPIGAGGRGGGAGKAILGAVIIVAAVAAAFYTGGASLGALGASAFGSITYGQIALVGLALTLSGIASLVSPGVKGTPGGQTTNYNFNLNGPVNTATEGQPIPLVYGQIRVGSVVGAMTMSTVDYNFAAVSPDQEVGDKNGVALAFTLN